MGATPFWRLDGEIEEPGGTSVTAAEFLRNFTRSRQMAERGPLYVTHHGHRTHVMLGIDQFDDLVRDVSARGTADSGQVAGALLQEFGEWLDEGMITLDADGRIETANAHARAICRTTSRIVGGKLEEALPDLPGSVLHSQAMRTLAGGEPTMAELPSPFLAGAWLRFGSFPWHGRTVLLLRDITAEVRRNRLADDNAAIVDLLPVLGGLGWARLSMRGTIERADSGFCDLVGLAQGRLIGVPMTDLVDIAFRPPFREALEAVFQSQDSSRLQTQVISNAGTVAVADAAIALLRGSYGAEGAVVVLSRVDRQPVRKLREEPSNDAK